MCIFLVPSESGEKITLGVTILLAFFVNSIVVSNYTPESASELSAIGIIRRQRLKGEQKL